MFKSVCRRAALMLAAILIFNAAVILALRWIPPPTTLFMLTAPLRPVHQEWVPWRDIAPAAGLAIIASEDQRFPEHHGFDFAAIRAAMLYNAHHRHVRGASTISQQTAKNLFLWRGRTYLRKGLEAYFTVQLEVFWDKKRILETYLNIVQFGPDIYGVEAAAEHYFHKHASQLTIREAASLAAILPDPRRLRPDRPSPYVETRISLIEGQMRRLDPAMISKLR